MRTSADIRIILNELAAHPAHLLEDQDLDFKEWNRRSRADAVALVVEMAVCMANGGGGTVVFGVHDQAIGRDLAIIGVPPEIDINLLKRAVYDRTDPKLTPVFEELRVPEGTGRLLIMQVYPGLPPYTDTEGRAKIRIGTDCQPLTGTMRRRIMIETGETDYTAVVVPGEPSTLISPIAMEQLRRTAERERAPDDLLRLHDIDLLAALGVLRDQGLTRAGVLLAGGERAIGEHVPGYVWTHLRMRSDTQYSDRLDGRDALPIALARLIDRIMADNQIATVVEGMFHFEYRTYPEVALREALMNALGHADFRLAGPVLVKQYAGRLEVSNPGSFIGGISSSNILHHPPVARNPNLVEALTRLRLINRSSLGVPRMFEALLIEGKEPPIIEERGEGVTVTFRAGELSVPFRAFTAEEARRGRLLTVDHLLVLRYLLSHAEIDIATAARMCQRSELETRELLSQMERERDYLERGGTPRDTFWKLRAALYNRLVVPSQSTRDRRIAWEASKALVVSVLRRRAEGGDLGLTNAEVRGLTQLNRFQVFRLIGELERDGALTVERRGRSTRYVYRPAETS